MKTSIKIVALMASSASANIFTNFMFESEPEVETQQQEATEELYSWNYVDVYENDGFMYYKNEYFYVCYNGFSYYLENGNWYFNFLQWDCHYDSAPMLGYYDQYYDYMYDYLPSYLYDFINNWYSWDAQNVYTDGGYLYYQNNYFYACYNGYQYYFADGTWYWNVWDWSCQQSDFSTADSSIYYLQYLQDYDPSQIPYFEQAAISSMYSWDEEGYYSYYLYNGYYYSCDNGYLYWFNYNDATWEWDATSWISGCSLESDSTADYDWDEEGYYSDYFYNGYYYSCDNGYLYWFNYNDATWEWDATSWISGCSLE